MGDSAGFHKTGLERAISGSYRREKLPKYPPAFGIGSSSGPRGRGSERLNLFALAG